MRSAACPPPPASTHRPARTRTIDGSDSPTWNESLELCVPPRSPLAPPAAHDRPSAASDARWKLKLTLVDAAGASLGVISLKASDLDLATSESEWFNLDGPAAARIAVNVQQRETMCDPRPAPSLSLRPPAHCRAPAPPVRR